MEAKQLFLNALRTSYHDPAGLKDQLPNWTKPEHKDLVDFGLRVFLTEALTKPLEERRRYVEHCLRVLGEVCEAGNLLRPRRVFYLIDELFEGIEISEIDYYLDYIDQNCTGWLSKQGQDIKDEMMVPLFQGVLKRLSKLTEPILIGRIFVKLGCIIPMFNKILLNLKGEVNQWSKLTYEENVEDKADISTEADGVPLKGAFYKLFWQLVSTLPRAEVLTAQELETTIASMDKVLDIFDKTVLQVSTQYEAFMRTQALASTRKSTAAAPTTTADSYFSSQSQASDHSQADDPMVIAPADPAHSGLLLTRYITKPTRALALQLMDPFFRLQVLAHLLIFINTLRYSGVAGQVEVTDIQGQKLMDLRKKARTLMEKTPYGKRFSLSIQLVLARDSNWVMWKQKKGLPFDKLPSNKRKAEEQPEEESAPKRVKRDEFDFKPDMSQFDLGSPQLSQIWNQPKYEYIPPPSIDTFRADMEYKKMAGDPILAWKATRIIRKERLGHVVMRLQQTKMKNADVDDYVGLLTDLNYVKPKVVVVKREETPEIEEKELGLESQPKPAETEGPKPPPKVKDAMDVHVKTEGRGPLAPVSTSSTSASASASSSSSSRRGWDDERGDLKDSRDSVSRYSDRIGRSGEHPRESSSGSSRDSSSRARESSSRSESDRKDRNEGRGESRSESRRENGDGESSRSARGDRSEVRGESRRSDREKGDSDRKDRDGRDSRRDSGRSDREKGDSDRKERESRERKEREKDKDRHKDKEEKSWSDSERSSRRKGGEAKATGESIFEGPMPPPDKPKSRVQVQSPPPPSVSPPPTAATTGAEDSFGRHAKEKRVSILDRLSKGK